MKFAERPLLATLASAAVLLAATGCSVLEPDKIDYKSAGRGVSLEVPPDLTQLPGQSRYAVTGGAATCALPANFSRSDLARSLIWPKSATPRW